jgi:hypothetical protein
LIGTDSQINAARPGIVPKPPDDVLKERLVGDEVIGTKDAAGLGEIRDQTPECFVAELCGKLFCRGERYRASEAEADERYSPK